MRIIQLPDVLHEYLVHVIEKHAGQGIHPEEGIAVARLYEAVQKATHFEDAELQKMAAAATPQGQSPVPSAPTQQIPEPGQAVSDSLLGPEA